MVSKSVYVVTSFITKNNWFNAISNIGFQQSFVTITLKYNSNRKIFYFIHFHFCGYKG